MINLDTNDLNYLLDWVLPYNMELQFNHQLHRHLYGGTTGSYDVDGEPSYYLRNCRWWIRQRLQDNAARTGEIRKLTGMSGRDRAVAAMEHPAHISSPEVQVIFDLRMKFFKRLTKLELAFVTKLDEIGEEY